jgi:hypothetical protein
MEIYITGGGGSTLFHNFLILMGGVGVGYSECYNICSYLETSEKHFLASSTVFVENKYCSKPFPIL